MAKQVQQFITRMNHAIKNEGLLQLSGTRFNKGASAMDALRAKAYEAGCSVGQAAVDMNSMMDYMDVADGKSVFRKRLNSGIVPKSTKVAKSAFKPLKFDDSQGFDLEGLHNDGLYIFPEE